MQIGYAASKMRSGARAHARCPPTVSPLGLGSSHRSTGFVTNSPTVRNQYSNDESHVCRVETPFINPWQRYCHSLERQPFITKAFTSLIGFMLGDILAQKLEGAVLLDFGRVIHLGMYGFFLDGPVGHIWYKWLDGTCDKVFEKPKGAAAVATKTSADQLVWAPVMTAVFFAFLQIVEGHPDQVWSVLSEKVLPTVAANYVVWPAAHVISFKFVPSQQRILYNNFIAIFWNAYLSIVAASNGVDVAAVGNFDAGMVNDLMSLRDVAEKVQTQLPYDWSQGTLPSAPMLEKYTQVISAVSEIPR